MYNPQQACSKQEPAATVKWLAAADVHTAGDGHASQARRVLAPQVPYDSTVCARICAVRAPAPRFMRSATPSPLWRSHNMVALQTGDHEPTAWCIQPGYIFRPLAWRGQLIPGPLFTNEFIVEVGSRTSA